MKQNQSKIKLQKRRKEGTEEKREQDKEMKREIR